MSIHRASAAQRRIAKQQLVHVLRSQLTRVQATVARQQQVIAAQERDLIDLELAHSAKEWDAYVARYSAAADPAQQEAAPEQQSSKRDELGRFTAQR